MFSLSRDTLFARSAFDKVSAQKVAQHVELGNPPGGSRDPETLSQHMLNPVMIYGTQVNHFMLK